MISTNYKKKNDKNIIEGELYFKLEEINFSIILFKTEIIDGIEVFLNNKKINMTKDGNKWKYNVQISGIYNFKIIFNFLITNLEGFFEDNSHIISLDFSNFDVSYVTNMSYMFHECNLLKEIKAINKFNTKNVLYMNGMFQLCSELEYLDLSEFETSNVVDMHSMFSGCHKLKEIKGVNKFITQRVIDMKNMFQECNLLEYLDLSNYNTSNVTDMS